jgi:hypothetical protein
MKASEWPSFEFGYETVGSQLATIQRSSQGCYLQRTGPHHESKAFDQPPIETYKRLECSNDKRNCILLIKIERTFLYKNTPERTD